MKLNMNVRWQNKTWFVGFIALIVKFIYDVLASFEIVPVIEQGVVNTLVETVATLLVGLGVLIDPTTKGVSDSERALKYTEPN